MLRAKVWIGLLLAALALIGATRPADAVNLWASNVVGQNNTVGGSVTVGGLTIKVTSCTAKIGGTNLTTTLGGCGILNLQLIALPVVGGNVQIEILGASSGPIFSTANNITTATGTHILENAGLNDLAVVLSITSSTKTVNNVGATLTGSVSGTGSTATKNTERGNISMGENIASASPLETASISGLSLSSLAAGVYSGSVSASTALTLPTANFTVTKDIRMSPTIGGVDTLVLSNVIQTYKTPEPASIALMLVGLGGLAAARHYRRR